MINIECTNNLEEKHYEMIGSEFNKYAKQNGVICNYQPINFLAKDGERVIGLITGNSYYNEVHIGDLIVLEEYRKNKIGSQLLDAVEKHVNDKGFEHINLTTYEFQAPKFYEKCGYEVEYIRENKKNPKLNKYFLVKYF